MICVSIKRDGIITNKGEFSDLQQAQAWIDYHESAKTFGDIARTVQQEVEVAPAVLAEDGEILVPAQMEMQEVHIPGYELVIEDLTQKLEQEKANAEAQKFLDESDWKVLRHRDQQDMGLATSLSGEEFQELLRQRQMAREAIIK